MQLTTISLLALLITLFFLAYNAERSFLTINQGKPTTADGHPYKGLSVETGTAFGLMDLLKTLDNKVLLSFELFMVALMLHVGIVVALPAPITIILN